MKRKTIARMAAALICGALTLGALAGCGGSKKIVIGSKDFSENIVIGEMLAQLVEAHTDITVERKLNMGGTFVNFEAIKNGQIDVYTEYTGTAYTAQLEYDEIDDPSQIYDIVKDEFASKFNVTWLEPLGFNNTYAMAVKAEMAEEYGLKTCSDLAKIADQLVFGAEHEFFDRMDGYDGFIEAYGIPGGFQDVLKMNVSLKYQAIGQGQMDVTDVFSTDGQIIEYDLAVLEDDLSFFPPYDAAPVVRTEILEKYPELKDVLNMMAGVLNEEEMTKVNYQVDVEKKSIESVAADFLKSKGLI